MNFEDRDKTGEDDGFPENPFADELWELYKPRVREISFLEEMAASISSITAKLGAQITIPDLSG